MTVARDGAIQVDDLDEDELPDDELDEDDDELDEDGLDEEPDEPPAQTRRRDAKPTYKDLLAENTKLREGNSRNNRELATRRHLEGFMKTHQITNLDQWLTGIGVDPASGHLAGPPQGTGDGSGSPTEPLETPPAGDGNTQTQEQPPEAPAAPAGPSEQEIERRIQLEVAQRLARENPSPADTPEEPTREEILAARLKDKEIDNILTRLNFSGDRKKLDRVLDATGIELDENNEVVGADAAIQEVRAEFPEWFRRRPAGTPPPQNGGESVDGGDKRAPGAKAPTWEQRVVQNWQRGH